MGCLFQNKAFPTGSHSNSLQNFFCLISFQKTLNQILPLLPNFYLCKAYLCSIISDSILQKLDENRGHVIASNFLIGGLGYHPLEHILQNYLGVGLHVPLTDDVVDHVLAISYVSLPNPVAAHNYELVVGMPGHRDEVGLAGYHLLVVLQVGRVLVLEVT
jgi:hypothetical protein